MLAHIPATLYRNNLCFIWLVWSFPNEFQPKIPSDSPYRVIDKTAYTLVKLK